MLDSLHQKANDMATVCVDASFIIRLVTLPPTDSPYVTLWEQWITADADIVAPSLLNYEVANVLHRQVIAQLLTAEEAEQLLHEVLEFPIILYQDASLHRRAYSLAQQMSLPAAYDAHYLALSERLNADFWTCDRRLFNLVQATLPWVHLVT
jgi:predicted nucleic acid-binding protein